MHVIGKLIEYSTFILSLASALSQARRLSTDDGRVEQAQIQRMNIGQTITLFFLRSASMELVRRLGWEIPEAVMIPITWLTSGSKSSYAVLTGSAVLVAALAGVIVHRRKLRAGKPVR